MDSQEMIDSILATARGILKLLDDEYSRAKRIRDTLDAQMLSLREATTGAEDLVGVRAMVSMRTVEMEVLSERISTLEDRRAKILDGLAEDAISKVSPATAETGIALNSLFATGFSLTISPAIVECEHEECHEGNKDLPDYGGMLYRSGTTGVDYATEHHGSDLVTLLRSMANAAMSYTIGGQSDTAGKASVN